jgi:hypothetical protein
VKNRILPIGAVLLALPAPEPVRGGVEAEQELIRIENAWRKARVAGDVAFLESLYAREPRTCASDSMATWQSSPDAIT